MCENKSVLKYLVVFLVFTTTISWSQNLSATGNQPYCPKSEINIVTDFNIDNPDDTPIDAIYIQISTGYVQGEDVLKLNGIHPKIVTPASWSPLEGKLTLKRNSASVPFTDLVSAVNDVVFESTSDNPSNKEFSITIGDANYLPKTEHYYQYIPEYGITWTDAKLAAASKTYFGLQGYLATLTSAEEAKLCGEQAAGAGWIGGTDEESEGVWKWVTGPEGENGGTVFWNGGVNGTTPTYANWNNNEPNNVNGGENYAHITDPSIGIPGAWNDLRVMGDPPGTYHPKGYIVEYGGMPGDPDINIAASTKIYTASILNIISDAICDDGMVTLEATASPGVTVAWFDAQTNGTMLHEGSIYEPTITETTTYYVGIKECINIGRTAVTATVTVTPTITGVQNGEACGLGLGTLEATASSGTIKWYETETGGTSLHTGTSYTISGLTVNKTYYVDATLNNCTTSRRTPVTLTVNTVPEFEVIGTTIYCSETSPIILKTFNPKDDYRYEWRNSTGELISSEFNVEVSSGGIYTVVATSKDDCSSLPIAVLVIESDKAKITSEDITIIENSDNNTILINNENNNLGIGDYEFALDAVDGPYKEDPFFNNVKAGLHTIYVKDKNACGSAQLEVFILGFPKFFTPNNDGVNDTWQVKGLDANYSNASVVSIFDRYGKLIKQINAKNGFWDGTFNGQSLASSDYWFIAELVDASGIVNTYKGHFSLVR